MMITPTIDYQALFSSPVVLATLIGTVIVCSVFAYFLMPKRRDYE